METIKAARQIIKKGIALLPDEAKSAFKANASDIFIDEAIGNALGAANENEEKIAMLEAYAVQEANRVVSELWREELLPENLETEYRKLPKMTDLAKKYEAFVTARKDRMDKIMAAHKVIAEEEKDLDIFKGIVNGISAKEAEKKYNEFKRQQQAALGGAR